MSYAKNWQKICHDMQSAAWAISVRLATVVARERITDSNVIRVRILPANRMSTT